MEGLADILNDGRIYRPEDIKEVMAKVRHYFRFSYSNKKYKYFNVPCSFDIETTSFYNPDGEKTAIMYMWSFCIYGAVIIGRTWDEFITMIQWIVDELKLTDNKRLIIYVHNFAYEFGFISQRFTWQKLFAIDNRKPIYALTPDGVEFRCSYLLSGYSLAKLGDELQTYKVSKLVGGLDYSKMRHEKTALTDTEILYSALDVKVVVAFIAEKIDNESGIARIPLTKTGYVRNYCRNKCFYDPELPRKKSYKRLRFTEMMKTMTMQPDEYLQLKRAFQGGFTHANPFYSGKTLSGKITSFDFTSSYPTVLIAEKFPMSSAEEVEIQNHEDLEKNLKLYCCLFEVEIWDLSSTILFESYISSSRCRELKKAVINNGRVVSAEHLCLTVTEQDYMIIRKFYTWGKIRIYNFRRYKKDYLPKDFVLSILELYEKKTTLKNVDGKEVEYLSSKSMINSLYGMTVYDPCRVEYFFNGEVWEDPTPPTIPDAIEKYNKSRSRFTFYPWGVWCTAYARKNLFTGILEFANDYIYADTDSVKVLNAEKHMTYINEYNTIITEQLEKALEYHGIDKKRLSPSTIDGVKKPLGVWDFDGEYSRFKTLGAKRYMVEYSNDKRNGKKRNEINITVAGLNKKICVPYLKGKYGEKIFDAFTTDLYIPPEYTGKNTHTYIDEQRDGILTDYNGIPCEYHEKTGVHLQESEYSLSIAKEYADYLYDIQSLEI